MCTQIQIRRFNELRRAADFHRETILHDIMGPDGILMVDLQVPGVGKVRRFISPDGNVRMVRLNN